MGALWGRIYAPDRGTGPFGGVALPRAWFETPRRERYVMLGNAAKFEQRAHATMPAREDAPADPKDWYGPGTGWGKSFGIVLSILEGSARAWKWSTPEQMAKIRNVDLGATGRGQDQPAPLRTARHHRHPQHLSGPEYGDRRRQSGGADRAHAHLSRHPQRRGRDDRGASALLVDLRLRQQPVRETTRFGDSLRDGR
jgi:hypothetical protein